MKSAAECLAKAIEYEEKAAAALTTQTRELLLRAATEWRELAKQASAITTATGRLGSAGDA